MIKVKTQQGWVLCSCCLLLCGYLQSNHFYFLGCLCLYTFRSSLTSGKALKRLYLGVPILHLSYLFRHKAENQTTLCQIPRHMLGAVQTDGYRVIRGPEETIAV